MNQRHVQQKKGINMNALEYHYQSIFCRDMILKMNYSNTFECIKFSNIQVNFTSKYVVFEKKQVLPALLALTLITGQRPKTIRAKKSVASFKLKAQNLLGASVTLRHKKMFAFLQHLSQIIFPKLKDFQSFQLKKEHKGAHVSIGLQSFLLFPEVEKKVEIFEHLSGCALNFKVRGAQTSRKDIHLLLSGLRFPCVLI